MTEMLGVLAIIGVLSVGAIGGYSYAMDKWRANETVNQIRLRAIDLMSQAAQGNDTLSFSAWQKEKTLYDFGTPDYTDDGLIVFDVGKTNPIPKKVCEIVYDNMKNMVIQIDIKAVRADLNDTCGDDNEMTFYFGETNTSKNDSSCLTGQYYENGMCFNTGLADMNSTPLDGPFEGECDRATGISEKCGQCQACFPSYDNNGKNDGTYICLAGLIGTCTIDGKDGICQNGECYPVGCTTNDDCKTGTYCASPNNSAEVRFQSGETGACVDLNFVRHEIKGKAHYISNLAMSWWNAEFACDALGKVVNKNLTLARMSDFRDNWCGSLDYCGTESGLGATLRDMGYGGVFLWTNDTCNDVCEPYQKIHHDVGDYYDSVDKNNMSYTLCVER